MGKVTRIGIFASGEGTNAENIMVFAKKHPENFCVRWVLTDNPRAGVIKRCHELSMSIHVVPLLEKSTHEESMMEAVGEEKVDVLCLAGFMRVLSESFLKNFNAVLNIHPSWLPEFPGLKSYERAFESGQNYSGVTVHFVDGGIDSGPILVQEKFYRDPRDTRESFEQKGRVLEEQLYPRALLKLRESL